MAPAQTDLHDLSVQIGRLLAREESATSQRADTYKRVERLEERVERVVTILETLPDKIEKIGEKLDEHAKQDNDRLTVLEHERTRMRTTIKILSGILGFFGLTSIGSIWAMFKAGVFAALR